MYCSGKGMGDKLICFELHTDPAMFLIAVKVVQVTFAVTLVQQVSGSFINISIGIVDGSVRFIGCT